MAANADNALKSELVFSVSGLTHMDMLTVLQGGYHMESGLGGMI